MMILSIAKISTFRVHFLGEKMTFIIDPYLMEQTKERQNIDPHGTWKEKNK